MPRFNLLTPNHQHHGPAHDYSHLGSNPDPRQWPCRHCGALRPMSNGQDPCIADLPGVIAACCGHGNPAFGYLLFEDGRALYDIDFKVPPKL